MVDKDFRHDRTSATTPDFDEYLLNRGARPADTPVKFFDKPTYADTGTVIKYTDDGRPITPRYDEPVEEPAPKDSPAPESADTLTSQTDPTSVAGLEDLQSPESSEPPASVEKETTQTSAPPVPQAPPLPGR